MVIERFSLKRWIASLVETAPSWLELLSKYVEYTLGPISWSLSTSTTILPQLLEVWPDYWLPVWSAYPADLISANIRIQKSGDSSIDCSRREDSKPVAIHSVWTNRGLGRVILTIVSLLSILLLIKITQNKFFYRMTDFCRARRAEFNEPTFSV